MSSCHLESLSLLLQICCGIYLITWLIFMLFMQTVQKEKGEALHPQLCNYCSTAEAASASLLWAGCGTLSCGADSLG